MDVFIVLPHQLFETHHLNSKYKYVIWEHPHYFNKYNYNKKKILMHKASMLYYYDYLNDNGFTCDYINFNEKFDIPEYTLFDPIDNIELPNNYSFIESPNFLLTKEIYSEYRNKTDKFFFNYFYMWSKKRIDIMPGIKSQDKLNRNKLKKNINIPESVPDVIYKNIVLQIL